MTQKVIILDFDVPLRNVLSVLATRSAFALNPAVMQALSNFCMASGVKVVCSSNTAPLYDETSYLRVTGWLRDAGFDLDNLHPDWSCRTSNDHTHDNDINGWLSRHPEVTHYAAIDDLPLTVKNLIRITDHWNGLKSDDFQLLADYLELDLLKIINSVIQSNPQAGISRIKRLPPPSLNLQELKP